MNFPIRRLIGFTSRRLNLVELAGNLQQRKIFEFFVLRCLSEGAEIYTYERKTKWEKMYFLECRCLSQQFIFIRFTNTLHLRHT